MNQNLHDIARVEIGYTDCLSLWRTQSVRAWHRQPIDFEGHHVMLDFPCGSAAGEFNTWWVQFIHRLHLIFRRTSKVDKPLKESFSEIIHNKKWQNSQWPTFTNVSPAKFYCKIRLFGVNFWHSLALTHLWYGSETLFATRPKTGHGLVGGERGNVVTNCAKNKTQLR